MSTQTVEEKAAQRWEWFIDSLNCNIEGSQAAVEESAQKMLEYSAYRLDRQWSALGDHLANLGRRDLWAQVQHLIDSNGSEPVDAVGYVLDDCVTKLTKNWLKATSTNPASNACEMEQAAQAARFIEDARSLLRLVVTD